MEEVPDSLLATDKPAAVAVHNENGSSPLLIVVDHADNLTPQAFGRLGVNGIRVSKPHRLGYRGRRGFSRLGGSARRHVGVAAELFAPGHGLEPPPNLRSLDPENQRIDPDSRKHELERKKPCSAARDSPLTEKTLDGSQPCFTDESNSRPR